MTAEARPQVGLAYGRRRPSLTRPGSAIRKVPAPNTRSANFGSGTRTRRPIVNRLAELVA
jgi:hypothetical protein